MKDMLHVVRKKLQVVTVLKNTTKFVEDVPFPALTLCGSGVHMNNVEKKLVEDFKDWRTQKRKDKASEEQLDKDMKEFMEDRFQIKESEKPINILDILDMMIAPDVDASIAANSVRENEIACQQMTKSTSDKSECKYSCADANFALMGTKCFFVSSEAAKQPDAVTACRRMGAQLATISTFEENAFVWTLGEGGGPIWFGLEKQDGRWVWQDGSTDPTYRNWGPNRPNSNDRCVRQAVADGRQSKWNDYDCLDPRQYACSMAAEPSCQSKSNETEIMESLLQKRACIPITRQDTSNLPAIDIFLNPAKEEAKEELIKKKIAIAKKFFNDSDMKTLYPELFHLLWESTLPCFEEDNKEEHMILSCKLAGVEVNCSSIFTRVPTDTGMCCALNVKDSLRMSEYKSLVTKMQGDKKAEKVKSRVGARNGLTLTLDLHSNTVSLGTLDQQHSTFKLFIGEPAQFPMMLDKSIPLQPGREHFVDLSVKEVSTNNIREISPEDRGCLFNDESDLEFYTSYTFSNCRLECGIKEAEKRHNCIPWHLPKVS